MICSQCNLSAEDMVHGKETDEDDDDDDNDAGCCFCCLLLIVLSGSPPCGTVCNTYHIFACWYIIVTGTDLTQTSASGSFMSELGLMRAYLDWASVYTLI